MINPMDLTGKQYLVTGASSGLGRQVCVTLNQLGARVLLVARNETKLKETLSEMKGGGLPHSLIPFDLNDLEKTEDLIKNIVETGGKLDGFVHCAGIGTMKPLAATTSSFMEEMMRVNVYSFIELARCISKKKNCNPGTSIVAVSSAASIRGDKAKVAYCSSKGALDSAVQAMAAELGTLRKIRVNSVNPAWIQTPMYMEYIKALGDEKEVEINNRQFMGVAKPEDIASLIAFLLSGASRQITGQSIIIDGGRTLW